MKNKAIIKAIEILGSQGKLATACGLTQTTTWKWANGLSKVSPQHVPLVVKATKGKVKPWEIRPDLPELFPKKQKATNAN